MMWKEEVINQTENFPRLVFLFCGCAQQVNWWLVLIQSSNDAVKWRTVPLETYLIDIWVWQLLFRGILYLRLLEFWRECLLLLEVWKSVCVWSSVLSLLCCFMFNQFFKFCSWVADRTLLVEDWKILCEKTVGTGIAYFLGEA